MFTTIENFTNVGERLSARMKDLKLKQVDICTMTGISKNAVSNYVSGNRTPDTLAVYKLSKVLDVTIEWILTGEELNINQSANNTQRFEELKPEDAITLKSYEIDMINKFRILDQDDKQDTLDIIEMKYNRKVKRGTSSNSTSGGKGEEAATHEAV